MNQPTFIPVIAYSEEQLSETIRKTLRTELREIEIERRRALPQKLYTKNQVAKMLHKSFNTIKKWVEDGTLKSTKNGLIGQTDLDDFLAVK